MKALFVAVLLGIASPALYAQVFERDQSRGKAAAQPDNARAAERRDHERRDRQRRQRDEPPVERQTSEGPVKLDRVRPPQTQRQRRSPGSQPSPAEQRQRELYEQRQPR